MNDRIEQIEARAEAAPDLSPDDLDAIQAPLPDEARMDAYYYGFERTGVGFIDGILSAVAVAGKGSHHTQSWNEESDYGYYANRPGLPDAISAVDLIQKAAEAASENVAALLALAREQQARIDAAKADGWDEGRAATFNDPIGIAFGDVTNPYRAALTATEGAE